MKEPADACPRSKPLEPTPISGGDLMSDEKLTQDEMQNVAGGHRPPVEVEESEFDREDARRVDEDQLRRLAGAERTAAAGTEIRREDARRVDEDQLRRLAGAQRGARAAEVPDEMRQVSAVDIKEIVGGSNAVSPIQIRNDDGGSGGDGHERVPGVRASQL